METIQTLTKKERKLHWNAMRKQRKFILIMKHGGGKRTKKKKKCCRWEKKICESILCFLNNNYLLDKFKKNIVEGIKRREEMSCPVPQRPKRTQRKTVPFLYQDIFLVVVVVFCLVFIVVWVHIE